MIKNAKLNWVRLPLEGVENCRELGGYNTQFGQQTKWHELLRSSDMSKLTEKDIDFLRDYGVKTIIDLRGEDEIQESTSGLANKSFCHYHNIPLITDLVSNMEFSTGNRSMGDFYVELLDNSKVIHQIFDCIAQAESGAIVFHCAAGKDRTGILAMLLLGLAGVEKKDILSNYEVSYTNLESMRNLEKVHKDIPKEFMYSKSRYIEKAYEYLTTNYETVEQYLLTKGVDEAAIEAVKTRLVGKDPVMAV